MQGAFQEGKNNGVGSDQILEKNEEKNPEQFCIDCFFKLVLYRWQVEASNYLLLRQLLLNNVFYIITKCLIHPNAHPCILVITNAWVRCPLYKCNGLYVFDEQNH